jgi:hypothetical protein
MKTIIKIFFVSFLSFISFIQAQENYESQVEVFLIDSYVTPELPNRFVLSFFTSEPVKSKVLIEGKYEFEVSNELTDNHKTEIDITDLGFLDDQVPFIILMEDSTGEVYKSEQYDFIMPYEVKVDRESNFLLLCLFGGTVLAVPSPVYIRAKDDNYFSLTKEIPLLSFRSKSFIYPMGYFSLEYSHVFKATIKNYLRFGYKHVIEIPGLEYIAPGVNGFTNFKGYNGISPEVSLGLFRAFSAFTVYTRYRFNAKPGDAGSEFHEFSIGLYSSFFTIYY